MPKVSIIVPTYNVEQYLVECMESITNQTLEDIEVICINDGSTDGSLSILQSYADKDKRIIIVDKENGGYGIGMNIGLEMATGEYIGIVEPDDFVPVNMFGNLYDIAKGNNLDFVKADFYRFERATNGDMFLTYNHLSKKEEDYNVVFNPSETPEAIRWIMNTWSGIYKREFLNKWNIRHNETPGASFQDNGFWFQTFVFATRAMIIDKPYYMNRRDNPNSSVKNMQKVFCVNVEYDHIKDVLIEHPETWNRFKSYYTLKRFHNCLTTLRRIDNSCKLDYVNRFSKEMKRAYQLDEIDEELFTAAERDNIKLLINQPNMYYKLKALPMNNGSTNINNNFKQVKTELDKIKRSHAYKVGKMIMYFPSKFKRFAKRVYRKINKYRKGYVKNE
ncbi:MAG: glycosyltransferase [Eubacterium sp.]|nr:glycosyltransferase [Eubacterium sp.]MDE6505695.1 glycosyltransferase [Eubacterium sp.]